MGFEYCDEELELEHDIVECPNCGCEFCNLCEETNQVDSQTNGKEIKDCSCEDYGYKCDSCNNGGKND